jgi:hypothetical protein
VWLVLLCNYLRPLYKRSFQVISHIIGTIMHWLIICGAPLSPVKFRVGSKENWEMFLSKLNNPRSSISQLLHWSLNWLWCLNWLLCFIIIICEKWNAHYSLTLLQLLPLKDMRLYLDDLRRWFIYYISIHYSSCLSLSQTQHDFACLAYSIWHSLKKCTFIVIDSEYGQLTDEVFNV